MSELSAEQEARNLLERLDVEDAQSYSAGEIVELANLISRLAELERAVARVREMAENRRTGPIYPRRVLRALDGTETW